MKTRNMTEGRPVGLILGIALPLMAGNVFQQLYTVVDAGIVGKVLGVSALAALGASDWFNWMFLGIVQGLAQGFTIPMAHAFGAEDWPRLKKSVGNAAVLAVITGLLIMAGALLMIQPALDLMDTPDSIRPMSAAYLTVLFSGLPLVMGYNLLAGILRAMGDGRSPLYAMVVASLVNIGLDLLFVMGFGWGVEGAAGATVIAQGCSCGFCLLRLRKLTFLHPSRRDFRLEGAMAVKLMKMGVPVSAQNAIIAIGGMIVQFVVNGMGVAFIAGYTATNKLYGILEIAAISYGYAMTTYTGQNLGAKKPDRIRAGIRAGLATGTLTACVIAAAMFLFGRGIVGLFIDAGSADAAETVRIACEYLWLMSAFLPVLYVLHIVRSALQGAGDTVMPMGSGIAEFVMRVGAALLLPGLIGYTGVFWAEVLAWAGADVILVVGWFRTFGRIRRELGA